MTLNKYLTEKHGLFYFLVILVVLSRLLPHPMNFTPIGALGLFSGAYIAHRRAWLVPLAALFVSDLFIGFYNPFIMLSVYVSFALSAVLARYALANKRTVLRIGSSAIASATILFVLSNFAHWATGLYYPLTFEGLTICYINAIPFYGNSILGNLFYAALLFGVYEGIKHLLNKEEQPNTI